MSWSARTQRQGGIVCWTRPSSPSTPSAFEALLDDVRAESWPLLEQESGLTRRRSRGGRCLPGRRQRHRLLGHGHHPAPALGGHHPDDQQPAAAARQHRPARRGFVPGARPQQRAGRPHHGHLGEAGGGACWTGCATCSASSRRARRASTSVESIKLMLSGRGKVFIALGRQLRRRHARHLRDLEGPAPVRAHGARDHQAQPQPHRPRTRRADPALPGPHRDRRAGRRRRRA